MLKSFAFGAVLVLGVATVSNAAILPVPTGASGAGILKAAEGCGPGMWRGPNGVCHPGGAAGAGVIRPCPPGMHLGPEGRRCHPN
jgi:hypothetical protein